MDIYDFLYFINKMEWNNLKFGAYNEDSGGDYQVHNYKELIDVFADYINFDKDDFYIKKIERLEKMVLDYNDYLEINDLLIQIERQVESKEVKEKIEKIGRILEKGIGE